MIKKLIPLLSIIVLFSLSLFPNEDKNTVQNGAIKRLTQSGNNNVDYPCLNDLGDKVLYILEEDEEDRLIKSIQCLDGDSCSFF